MSSIAILNMGSFENGSNKVDTSSQNGSGKTEDRLIACASYDGLVRFYDPRLNQVGVLRCHDHGVS